MSVYNTSSAYDLESFERAPKKQEQAQLRVVKSRGKKVPALLNARSIGTFFLVVMVMSLIVFNQTRLNEVTSEINTLNKEIDEIRSENTRLSGMIENTLSLQNVAELAQEMGMQKLDKYQIEYVSLYKENRIEVIESAVEPGVGEQVKMALGSAVRQLKEYIGAE